MANARTLNAGHRTLAGNDASTGGGGSGSLPAGARWTFDEYLSFGHGDPETDDNLPSSDGEILEFWMSPTLDADHAEPGQSNEWRLWDPIDELQLIVTIDLAILTGAGGRLIVTLDDVDTACEVIIPAGTSSGYDLEETITISNDGSGHVGVRFAPDEGLESPSRLRCDIRLRARWTQVPPVPVNEPAGMSDNFFFYQSNVGIEIQPATVKTILRIGDTGPENNFADQVSGGTVGPPTLEPNIINGLPAVRFKSSFSGSILFMGCQSGAAPSGLPAPGTPRTIYMAGIMRSPEGGCAWSQGFQDGKAFIAQMFLFAGTQYGYSNGVGVSAPFAAPVDYTGVPVVIAWYFTGTACYCEVNSVERAMTPNATDNEVAATGFCIGGWMPTGFTEEGIDFDMVVGMGFRGNQRGTATRAANIAYLRNKLGI